MTRAMHANGSQLLSLSAAHGNRDMGIIHCG